MATITLTNNDLRKMINEAVARLCEGAWYQSELLCRLPYPISIQFSDHAIDREYEREISEQDVIDDATKVISEIRDDFDNNVVRNDTKVRIINTETCLVSVAVIVGNLGKTRINRLKIITSYIWDGRYNLKGLKAYYPTDEESPRWREAVEWNQENQDKVEGFTDWKHDCDLEKLKKKAEWEYGRRNPYYTPDRETLMKRMNMTYDNREKAEKKKKKPNPYDGLSREDLEAIQDYVRRFDKEKIELQPISESVRRAVRQALHEHMSRQVKKNIPRR